MIYQQTNVVNPFSFEPTPTTIYGYDIAIKISSKRKFPAFKNLLQLIDGMVAMKQSCIVKGT